jgi:GDP-4-dehydro-6-deoxy-D-mannose reductase
MAQDAVRLLEGVRPEVVVQLTGGTSGLDSDLVSLAGTYIGPTVNLLAAVAQLDSPPAVFITGSAAEYGDPGGGRAGEDSVTTPVTTYGWVKLIETSAARGLADFHRLNVTVMRPFNVVGPDLSRSTALGSFRHQVLQGTGPVRRITCGNVEVVRDFVSTEFLGQAVAELIQVMPGGIVNICSGIGWSLHDVMRAVASLLNVELSLHEDPALAAMASPDKVIGDPGRLHSLVRVRADSSPISLAGALLGKVNRSS